jgi:hypothetical protein
MVGRASVICQDGIYSFLHLTYEACDDPLYAVAVPDSSYLT